MNLRRIDAMVMRHLYMFPRTLDRWSESIYWPVLDLVLWGVTTRWVENGRGDVPHLALAVLTAVVFWQVVWRANYEISVNLLEEMWNQNLVNLYSTPLTVWEWSLSLIILGVIKNLLTLIVGAGAVWMLYRLNVFTVGWMMLPFLFALMMSGWFMGFAASGVIIRFGKGLQSIAWMAGYALAPFSAVFYPLHVLPGWAQVISSALPMTYVFEGMRTVLRGDHLPLADLALSFGLNIVYLVLSVLFFGRMFEKSRERGLARLE
jgi:ABC-2 type transport system permease protein